MEIQISAKEFSLTESLRRRIVTRIEKLTKHRSDILGATVALTVERRHTKGEKYLAEARVMIPGNDVFAQVRAADMRLAIDQMAERLLRQLQKGKERRDQKKRQGPDL